MKLYCLLFLFICLLSCSSSDDTSPTRDDKNTSSEAVLEVDANSEAKDDTEITEDSELDTEDSDRNVNTEVDFSQTERPGLTNTGPNNVAVLKQTESIVVDAKWTKGLGTVESPFIVENVDIQGTLKIKVSNVLVRNFKVTANALYPVQTNNADNVTNVTLEDGEVIGGDKSSATILAKDGVTLRRLRLHETKGDGVKIQGSDFTMEGCWIYNLGTGEKAHADGVQGTVSGVGEQWKNHKYIGNFFDMSISKLMGIYRANATIFLHLNKKLNQDSGSGIDGIIVKNNWLIGGNFSLQIAEGMSDVTVENNKFGYKGKEVRFGNLRIDSPATVSGSVYYDTGLPIMD